jgi:amidase
MLQPVVERLASLIGTVTTERLAPTRLADWSEQQQVLQGREAWETARDWIDRVNPRLSFEVAERYLLARSISDADVAAAQVARDAIRHRMDAVLTEGTVVCLPTTPTPAPRRGERLSVRNVLRPRNSALTCIAGTLGAPQLTLPLGEVDGFPVGLSLLGARGTDELLIACARDIALT